MNAGKMTMSRSAQVTFVIVLAAAAKIDCARKSCLTLYVTLVFHHPKTGEEMRAEKKSLPEDVNVLRSAEKRSLML